MAATCYLPDLESMGITIVIHGDNMACTPANSLSANLRHWLKDHKPQIMDELHARDKATVLAYLDLVNETNPAHIQHALDVVAANPDTMAYIRWCLAEQQLDRSYNSPGIEAWLKQARARHPRGAA